jgi:flagellar biosynthesis protein FlhG
MKALWSRRRAMRIRIVVNRAASEDEARRVARRLGSLARRSLDANPEYLGLVYEDAAVGSAAHLMKPFVLVYPESPASVCVADLAGKLAAPPPAERSAPAEALRGGAA